MITAIPLSNVDDYDDVLEFITDINELILNGDLVYSVDSDGEVKLYAAE